MFKMTALKTVILISFLLLLTPKNSKAAGIDAFKIFLDTNKGTVSIKAYDEEGKEICLGTGFFVSKEGKVATNYHVIEGARKVVIKDYEKNEYELKDIVGFDIKKDLVIFRIDIKTPKVLDIGDSDKVIEGQRVCVNNTYAVAMGLVGVVDKKVYEGTIDGLKNSGELSTEIPTFLVQTTLPLFKITSTIPEDCSGGPVLDNNGKVIGILTSGESGAQNTSFAIPIKHLLALLQSTGEPKRLEDLPKSSKPPTIMGLTFGMGSGKAQAMFVTEEKEKIGCGNDYILGSTYFEVYDGSLVRVDIPEYTMLLFKTTPPADEYSPPQDKLYSITTGFDVTIGTMEKVASRYDNLQNSLTKKYGQPIKNVKESPPYYTFSESDTKEEHPILSGTTYNYSSEWEIQEMTIQLQLQGYIRTEKQSLTQKANKYWSQIKSSRDFYKSRSLNFTLAYTYKPLVPIEKSLIDEGSL
ncbi:MAG: S1C family serine protease [Candidatus Omnitrophota bacterium]